MDAWMDSRMIEAPLGFAFYGGRSPETGLDRYFAVWNFSRLNSVVEETQESQLRG